MKRKTLFIMSLFSFLLLEGRAWAQGLRDVRPPVNFPQNFVWLWLALVLFVLCGLGYLFVSWRQRRPAASRPASIKPPWVLAHEQLNALAKEDLPRRGLVKEFYARLSLIIRYYIEGRFFIRAPEMTTEEFLDSLRQTPALREEHKAVLREFLAFSDMVKFARHPARPEEIQAGLDLTKHFVDETTPMAKPEGTHSPSGV